jgi:ubiquinone/menaquinone biosynthesis C-methylase UbiE
MSTIVDRYHRDARDYARYWAPVLEGTAGRLLELVDDHVARLGGSATIIDVGTGTGSVAIAALARWPNARVIASDAAAGMLEVARSRAAAAGFAGDARLAFVHGGADRLPLDDGSVDIVLSAFVLQLVPDRLAALRESRRILRPGGRLAYVTWLDREARDPFRPMEEFDEAVLDLAIEEPEEAPERYAGDVPSARAASVQLRRAGFRAASAREDVLVHDWTADSYLEYKLAYDERALMSMLDDEQKMRLEENARRRLGRLRRSDFSWRPPIVFAAGTRPT